MEQQISTEGGTSMANQNASNQGGNFPLSDLCYDLITVIHEKSKALEAYDKYMRDAQNDVGDMISGVRHRAAKRLVNRVRHIANRHLSVKVSVGERREFVFDDLKTFGPHLLDRLPVISQVGKFRVPIAPGLLAIARQ